MFSLKNMLIFGDSKFVAPGAGLDRTYSGGISSRGPPSGRPIEAQAATIEAIAPIKENRIQAAAFIVSVEKIYVKLCQLIEMAQVMAHCSFCAGTMQLALPTLQNNNKVFKTDVSNTFVCVAVPRSRIELLSKV